VIGFLYPAFLAAAAAAALPVILHLVRRREVRRLTFPAMRYLRRAEQRHARRLRLRHLLLLSARVLIILLAAFAAAGPLVGRGGAADHRPTALAIVVDESLSSARLLGGRRLADLYAERARLALELLTAEDRIALFSAVRPGEGAVTTDPVGAREYLRELRPTAGVAELANAIRQAEAWLQAWGELRRELHVLTDLQRISAEAPGPEAATPTGAGRDVSVVVFSPELGPQSNGALGNPVPEAVPLTAGQHTRVSVALHWFGPERPSAPTVIRLVRGEDVVAAAEGEFGGSALLRMPPQDSGWVQGYVEIARHGLAADDRRYFTWFVRPAVRVALLGELGAFLNHAVEALTRGGRLSRVEPSEAEVWVSSGGQRIEEALVAGASVLVVPPSDPLELTRLNTRLDRARIPWRYEAVPGARGLARIAEGAPMAGLSGLEVREWHRLVRSALASGDTALIRLSSGEPWLVRGNTNDGSTYLLLASPLTETASDVPVSAGMVPLVDAMVGSWARPGVVGAVDFEGVASVRLPARAREVVYPDGSRTPGEGGAWLQVSAAGNYSATDGVNVLMAFSVNAPLIEADLTRGRPEDLEAALPAADWTWIQGTDPAAWQQAIFRARRGKLAWRPLVVLLLLASIVEAGLAAAGRRRSPGAAGPSIDETRYRA
jgi:hypothetical protein